jgi:hypothetical protein
MSQENVETMRTVIEAFNRRDGEAFGSFPGRERFSVARARSTSYSLSPAASRAWA